VDAAKAEADDLRREKDKEVRKINDELIKMAQALEKTQKELEQRKDELAKAKKSIDTTGRKETSVESELKGEIGRLKAQLVQRKKDDGDVHTPP